MVRANGSQSLCNVMGKHLNWRGKNKEDIY